MFQTRSGRNSDAIRKHAGIKMNDILESRRRFLKAATISAGAILLPGTASFAEIPPTTASSAASESTSANYTLRIRVSPVEIAPNRIISITTYNGQFPGPLVRLKEGQPATISF